MSTENNERRYQENRIGQGSEHEVSSRENPQNTRPSDQPIVVFTASNQEKNITEVTSNESNSTSMTPRTSEILYLALRGLRTKEIAEKIQMSPETVKKTLSTIYKSTETPTRAKLAASKKGKAVFPVTSQNLSPRQIDILQQLMLGNSNKEIAGNLGISEQTVKNHLRKLYDDIHVRNRVEAINYGKKLIFPEIDSMED